MWVASLRAVTRFLRRACQHRWPVQVPCLVKTMYQACMEKESGQKRKKSEWVSILFIPRRRTRRPVPHTFRAWEQAFVCDATSN